MLFHVSCSSRTSVFFGLFLILVHTQKEVTCEQELGKSGCVWVWAYRMLERLYVCLFFLSLALPALVPLASEKCHHILWSSLVKFLFLGGEGGKGRGRKGRIAGEKQHKKGGDGQ